MKHCEAVPCEGCKSHTPDETTRIYSAKFTKGDVISFYDNIYRIIFLCNGKALINNREVFDFVCEEQNMFLVVNSNHHTILFAEDSELVCLNFYSSIVSCDKIVSQESKPILDTLNYKFHTLVMREPVVEFVRSVRYYQEDGIDCRYFQHAKFYEAFILFRHYYSLEEVCLFFYPWICKYNNFQSLVIKNYTDTISSKALAEKCGYKYSNFEKLFRRHFNESPYKWMQKQKALHVRNRLLDRSVPIKVIVSEFGFSDQSHLNLFCNKHFNLTPLELRAGK